MCPTDPFEEARRAIRGEVTVDERLCASRPTSTPPGAPSDSPLAAALDAVERGLDGDDSVLVTPPYRIVREWKSKKRGATRKKVDREMMVQPETEPTFHDTVIETAEEPEHVAPRNGRRGGFKGLPNGDLL